MVFVAVRIVGFTAVPGAIEGLTSFGPSSPVKIASGLAVGVDLLGACPGIPDAFFVENRPHDL